MAEVEVVRGSIRAGDTLSRALGRFGVSHRVVHAIDRGLRPLFDFRRSRPGHRFELTRDAEGGLLEFRYQVSDLESFVLWREGDGYRAAHDDLTAVAAVARTAWGYDSLREDVMVRRAL